MTTSVFYFKVTSGLFEKNEPNALYLVNRMTASTLFRTTTTLVFQIFTQYITLVNNVREDIELGGGFFFFM